MTLDMDEEEIVAQKPETRFKIRILPVLRRIDLLYVEKIQQKSIRGTLDLILCVNGWYVVLELKVYGDLDPMQKRNMVRIRNANGYAIETTPENFPGVQKFLKILAKISHPRPIEPKALSALLDQS